MRWVDPRRERIAGERSADRPRRMAPEAGFFRANLAGWLFIAVLGIATRTIFFGDFRDAVLLTAIFDTVGFSLTSLAHLTVRNRLRAPISAFQVVPVAALASLAGGLIQMGVAEGLRQFVFVQGQFYAAFGGRIVPMFYYTVIFLGWSLAYFWLTTDHAARNERVQRSEAESAAIRAELQQLRVQLDPHFLFNALNTVTAEIHDRPDVAAEMTRRISDYMRYCLDHQDRSVCPLSDEIAAAGAYLRIQELRFDGQLTYKLQFDADAGDFPVPHLILQGLVENAVKHAVRPAAQAQLEITISAFLQGAHLSLIVTNPGRYAPRADRSAGLGLVNIRRRLELHYPQGHHLSVAQERDLVRVRMTLSGPLCFA